MIFLLIFLIVLAIVLYALRQSRWKELDPEPHQLAGNTKLEVFWTTLPFLIVTGLWIGTAYTMKVADPAPPPKPDIIIIGHQWWWEARYTANGLVVANEIHIPQGKPISIRLDASDVLHEFWVPELSRKITAVPGHPNHLWIESDSARSYLGFCSEFCGTQHAWMHFQVIASPAADFEQWQKDQLAPAIKPAGGDALKGAELFQQMTCVNCHSINGTSAHATVGPDLTHFASRRQIGAGIVDNTRANLIRWLANPHSVKPGVKMPTYHLNQEQVSQLADYLSTLK